MKLPKLTDLPNLSEEAIKTLVGLGACFAFIKALDLLQVGDGDGFIAIMGLSTLCLGLYLFLAEAQRRAGG